MFRCSLSLALTLSLTLPVACDQPASQPHAEVGDESGDETTDGAIEDLTERIDTARVPRRPSEPVRPPENTEPVLALEGPLVIPQTVLHLDSGGADCDGQAQMFDWSVTQPEGATAVFKPSATHPTPTLEANVAGDYTFELQSFGPDGALCAEPYVFMIAVVPESALHIELIWHTPNDPDETDEGPEAGSDLDLHVRHPLATGWFDSLFDCFWFNRQPNWGSLDPNLDDDPGLDLDDTDGAGPENFNLPMPEEGADYRIMVHSWSDHGYGDSDATVRVYLFGELTYESEPVSLTEHDAWEVGVVNLTEGFSPSSTEDGEPLVTPNLLTPFHP